MSKLFNLLKKPFPVLAFAAICFLATTSTIKDSNSFVLSQRHNEAQTIDLQAEFDKREESKITPTATDATTVNISKPASYSDKLIDGKNILSESDSYYYVFNGAFKIKESEYTFAKKKDVETTFYIVFDNCTIFNNSWGPGISGCFSNKFVKEGGSSGPNELVKATTPTHYVFSVLGDNYLFGHNHTGWRLQDPDDPNPESIRTYEFTTSSKGVLNIGSADRRNLGSKFCPATAYSETVNDYTFLDPSPAIQVSKIQVKKSTSDIGSSNYASSRLPTHVSNATVFEGKDKEAIFGDSRDEFKRALAYQSYDLETGVNRAWHGQSAAEVDFNIFTFTLEKKEVHVHVGTRVPAVPATCTEDGSIEYYTCTCGKLFEDASCTKEISIENTVVGKLGHDFSDPQYGWNVDGRHQFTCVASRHCKHSGCTEGDEQEANAISAVISSYPTSSKPGVLTVTASFDSKDIFPDASIDVDIPAFNVEGMSKYDINYEWYKNSFGEYVCSASATVKVELKGGSEYYLVDLGSEVAEVTSSIIVDPTRESDGLRRYVAAFQKDYFREGSYKDETEIYPWSEPTYQWFYPEGDIPYCVAYVYLKADPNHIEEIQGETTSEIILAPGLYTTGQMLYRTVFDDSRVDEYQEIVVDIPSFMEGGVDVSYEWILNEDGTYTCVAYAKESIKHSLILTEEGHMELITDVEPTCGDVGYGHYIATFELDIFELQVSDAVITIPATEQHIYFNYWIYDTMPTATEPGERSHHCSVCGHRADIEEVPATGEEGNPEVSKEITKSIIQPKDEETEQLIDEALEKIPEEAIQEIGAVVSQECNDLLAQKEAGLISEEEYQEKTEIVQAVATSSLIIASEQEENVELGNTLNSTMPENSPIDLGEVFDDFIDRQMGVLLNQQENKVSEAYHHAKDDDSSSNGINYDIDAETYNNAIEFVDVSIEHMGEASSRLRECSGETFTASVEIYITTVQYSTFQDYDKEKADAEFVESAYEAILIQMQSEVLSQLQQELESVESSRQSDPARVNLIKEQIAAVEDIEQFEIMVIEILRQNYVAITGTEISLEEFEPIYREIFKRWALNEEQDVDITLEELTNAVVDKKVNNDTKFNVNRTDLGKSEIIVFASLGGAIGLAIILSIVLSLMKKRKEGK